MEKEDIQLGHWMIYRLKPLNAFIMAGDADQVYTAYLRVSSTIQASISKRYWRLLRQIPT